jgi:hypothetical protein
MFFGGMPLETWVFVAILFLAGFLTFACGIKQELSVAYTLAGITIISFNSLIFVKRFREWIQKI